MAEAAKDRLALTIVLLIGAAAFFVGIQWGLPVKAVNEYLIPASPPASRNFGSAYGLSGAGIDHLAGGWEDDPDRGADVAQHPISDRTHPVTLLENPIPLSRQEILNRGNPALDALLKQQSLLYQKLQSLIKATARENEIEKVQRAYADQSSAINQYVAQYNATEVPGYTQALHNDAVNRARILRRYRLYTAQPDEMITLRSLAQMHPGALDFDPRLYQYGGLWIYPIGAFLKAAAAINLITLAADRGFYLDHPEKFGQFYVLMRGYSAIWGLVGVATIFSLVRRLTGGRLLAAVAALCFICLPVVLSLSHEAKPHLAGAVLLLLAVYAASRYARDGTMRSAIWVGIACGAAAGMVLTTVCGLIVIPTMSLLRGDSPKRFIVVCRTAILIAASVYFAANPYVAIHLLHIHQGHVLASNLGNSEAMYRRGPLVQSLLSAIRFVALGISMPLAIVAVAGIVVLAIPWRSSRAERLQRENVPGRSPGYGIGQLLAAISLIVFIQFTFFAATEPGEYAHFAIFPDAALMIAAVVAIALNPPGCFTGIDWSDIGRRCGFLRMVLHGRFPRRTAVPAPPESATPKLSGIARAFPKDRQPLLGIYQEPAPYYLRRVDLFVWKIVLLPRDMTPQSAQSIVDVIVRPVETLDPLARSGTPITWADKRFEIIQSPR